MTECYFCEAAEDIETHHIVPQRFEGSDAQSNLVDLCHDCHWKLERLYNKDFWEAIGIEDPRSTRETHITCDMHGCTNPATDSYTIAATTGSAHVHRCDKHDPTDKEPESDDTPQFTSISCDPAKTSVEHLEYVFENVIDEPPVKVDGILDVLGDSNKIDSINVLNERPDTHLLVRSGELEVHVEVQDGAWCITRHKDHPDRIDRTEQLDIVEHIIEQSEGDSSTGVSDDEIYNKAVEAGLSELDIRYCLEKLSELCRINVTPDAEYTTKVVDF